MQNNKLDSESGIWAQNPTYSSCGNRSIRPVLPRRAIHWSKWQKHARRGAQLMRLQLASTAKERGAEANSPSRRDLGASKHPPGAKTARERASSSPLPLLLSWAIGGDNIGEWSRQHERQCHSIDPLLCNMGYTRVPRQAETDGSERANTYF